MGAAFVIFIIAITLVKVIGFAKEAAPAKQQKGQKK